MTSYSIQLSTTFLQCCEKIPVALRDPERFTPMAIPISKKKREDERTFAVFSHLSTLMFFSTMKPSRMPVMVPPE